MATIDLELRLPRLWRARLYSSLALRFVLNGGHLTDADLERATARLVARALATVRQRRRGWLELRLDRRDAWSRMVALTRIMKNLDLPQGTRDWAYGEWRAHCRQMWDIQREMGR